MKILLRLISVFFITFIILPHSFGSEFLLGTGLHKVVQGRQVPSLYLGMDLGSTIFTYNGVGVQTEVYYQSTQHFSYVFQQPWGTFFGAKEVAGFGVGAFYTQRGYREIEADEETVKSDIIIGPSLRLALNFGGSIFVSLESTFGVSSLMFLVLSFQNTSSLNFGVRF